MMIDKYIKTKLTDKNEFRLDNSEFKLFNMNFFEVDFKIDTGCSYTTIPILRLGIREKDAVKYKKEDVQVLVSKIKERMNKGYSLKDAIMSEKLKSFRIGYGIERGGQKNTLPDFLNCQSLIDFEAISFKHHISNFILGNKNDNLRYEIGDTDVFINYNRKGNILLGMEIMKNWDIHIGNTANKETVFLACPERSLNDKYFIELNRLFETGNQILTSEM